MAELLEIPLDLQLQEAHQHIQAHRDKGHKFPEFLSPMFLRRFPAIMENQLSINWDTILGIYDRMPFFPITLIDTEILDNWAAHPSVWEVEPKRQHSRRLLAMVHYTLLARYKGQVAIVFRASFVLILSHQVRTSLSDTLSYLKSAKEDCVVLVSMPSKLTYSPQPWGGKPYTLLPISGNPDIDRGPLHSFVATTLPIASREGHGSEMPVHVKLLPCFGSSKQVRMELLWEPSLLRGPLWKNVVINVVCIFDVASPVSYSEKTDFLHISSFIPGIFPPHTCTWSAVIGRNP